MVLFFLSCQTMDMEPKAVLIADEIDSSDAETLNPPEGKDTETIPTTQDAPVELTEVAIDQKPQIVMIERPVYIPLPEKSEKKPPAGTDSVMASTDQGTIKPEDYSHAARLYDYHPDQVYEVYTQILRTTDIYLEPGEQTTQEPFISDTERWVVGAGVSLEGGIAQQHIYLKPKAIGLDATMIINTNKRVYHLIVRSYRTVYMPIVKWRYHDSVFPKKYIADVENAVRLENKIEFVDPRLLSFDYKITYNAFMKKPVWMPERVYDDGKRTYILFDSQTLQREMPGIFEQNDNVVNYRVNENMVIIDKLIEKITVKYGNKKITIEKKRQS